MKQKRHRKNPMIFKKDQVKILINKNIQKF